LEAAVGWRRLLRLLLLLVCCCWFSLLLLLLLLMLLLLLLQGPNAGPWLHPLPAAHAAACSVENTHHMQSAGTSAAVECCLGHTCMPQ
jgi:hypothetical protein